MASGDTLIEFTPQNNLPPDWLYVGYSSGSTEPSLGDDIFGDTSNAEGVLEYLALESGTWGGNDAAGYMLLSNWNGTAWTADENFTANSTTPANHGTLATITAAANFAVPGFANDKPFLAFDDTANEVAMFQGLMPRAYGGGGVTLTVGWMSPDQTSLDTSWKAFFMSVTDDVDNLLSKNFAAPQVNAAVTVASVAGEVDYFTITFTDGAQMDSVAVGELFYLLLMRDGQDSTADDMTGDAQVVFAELKET